VNRANVRSIFIDTVLRIFKELAHLNKTFLQATRLSSDDLLPLFMGTDT
jgi:hypothetical protein